MEALEPICNDRTAVGKVEPTLAPSTRLPTPPHNCRLMASWDLLSYIQSCYLFIDVMQLTQPIAVNSQVPTPSSAVHSLARSPTHSPLTHSLTKTLTHRCCVLLIFLRGRGRGGGGGIHRPELPLLRRNHLVLQGFSPAALLLLQLLRQVLQESLVAGVGVREFCVRGTGFRCSKQVEARQLSEGKAGKAGK